MLLDDGEAPGTVLKSFLDWVGPLPLLGHNALKYDLPVLRRSLTSVGEELRYRTVLDSLLLAPLAFGRDAEVPEVYGLESLHARLVGAAHDPAHRALDDCRATLTVVNACVQRLHGFPDSLQQVLKALPVPEFRLTWPPQPADTESLKAQVDAWLKLDARRTHVNPVGGKTPRTAAELLAHPRPGQETMLAEVARTLGSGGVSVIEAPTGTGKTRGYLYPALLLGKPGHPVIISTYTRQLQNQILDEARAVEQAGFSLHVLALKGQSNYLCPSRLSDWLLGKHDSEQRQLVIPSGEARAASLLLIHAQIGEFATCRPPPFATPASTSA